MNLVLKNELENVVVVAFWFIYYVAKVKCQKPDLGAYVLPATSSGLLLNSTLQALAHALQTSDVRIVDINGHFF